MEPPGVIAYTMAAGPGPASGQVSLDVDLHYDITMGGFGTGHQTYDVAVSDVRFDMVRESDGVWRVDAYSDGNGKISEKS